MLLLPLPSVLEELLACERSLVDTLSLELCHDLSLCSDRCVVGTWYPASVLALHTCATHEYILQRVVEHVTHVKHTCHVGWWDNDSIWLASVGLRVEKVVLDPEVVPLLLDQFG